MTELNLYDAGFKDGLNVGYDAGFKEAKARIKELEERLKATTNDAKEAEAYAEEIYAHAKELEAKLKKGVLVEYDNDDVISLSGFAGGASEGGAWSTLTLMKEEANGDISFREYKAAKDWEITLAELTGGKDE